MTWYELLNKDCKKKLVSIVEKNLYRDQAINQRSGNGCEIIANKDIVFVDAWQILLIKYCAS